jgi:GntR family transcriptional regulator
MVSTINAVKLTRGNLDAPLHVEIAAVLRRAIGDGEAGPGDRLPPARDLAAVLEVNRNTVLRALRTLRDEGLLEFRRGRGVTVMGAAPTRSALIGQLRGVMAFARDSGYDREEIIALIRTLP